MTIKLFPNPTSDYCTIAIEGAYSDVYQYALVNNLGQMVLRGTMSKNVWSFQKVLSMGQYPPGLYSLQIESSNKDFKTFKIIKI